MEKLTIERTLPIQGEPVNIYFHGSRGKSGQIILTYEEWLHFNKLIREGMDSLKRKNETRIEIVIKGVDDGKKVVVPQVKSVIKAISKEVLDKQVEAILQPVIEFDKEDQEAITKEEKAQGLVRSLLPEGEKNEAN